MYGMNARLCVNKPAVVQTRLSAVVRPADTIFVAEVEGNGTPGLNPPGASQSNVTGWYAQARHDNRRGEFAMCDGSTRGILYDDVHRTEQEANDAATEWAIIRQVYWYPTPDTKN